MAVTATFTVSGTKSGDITGSASGTPGTLTIGSFTITNPNSSDDWTRVTLAAGFNAITVPNAGLVGVWIFPPAGSTNGKTLKGITGDTGLAMHLTNPFYYSFPAGTTAFGIASVGIETLGMLWI